jgi:hypothetical protein
MFRVGFRNQAFSGDAERFLRIPHRAGAKKNIGDKALYLHVNDTQKYNVPPPYS